MMLGGLGMTPKRLTTNTGNICVVRRHEDAQPSCSVIGTEIASNSKEDDQSLSAFTTAQALY